MYRVVVALQAVTLSSPVARALLGAVARYAWRPVLAVLRLLAAHVNGMTATCAFACVYAPALELAAQLSLLAL